MLLSGPCFDGLTKIAKRAKMDWFGIKQKFVNGKHEDFVYDFENGATLSLEAGVSLLAEGMTEPVDDEFYRLSAEEVIAVRKLFKQFKIEEAKPL